MKGIDEDLVMIDNTCVLRSSYENNNNFNNVNNTK